MWLLVVAALGFVGGNGLFAYWAVYEFPGWTAVLSNHLAMAFMIDAFLTLSVLAVRFARQPIGRVQWPWFVVFALSAAMARWPRYARKLAIGIPLVLLFALLAWQQTRSSMR